MDYIYSTSLNLYWFISVEDDLKKDSGPSRDQEKNSNTLTDPGLLRGKPLKQTRCTICNKNLPSPSQLAQHLLIHTGEKPFECGTCGKCFRSSGDLRKHINLHTREKRYECDICEKFYYDASALRRHKFVHTGEKSYECDTCGKLF